MAQRLKIAGNCRPAQRSNQRRSTRRTAPSKSSGRRAPAGAALWFDGPYFEELEVSDRAVDLSRMNNGAAVLNAHGTYDVNRRHRRGRARLDRRQAWAAR
jgi:hypothetical protein